MIENCEVKQFVRRKAWRTVLFGVLPIAIAMVLLILWKPNKLKEILAAVGGVSFLLILFAWLRNFGGFLCRLYGDIPSNDLVNIPMRFILTPHWINIHHRVDSIFYFDI